MTTEIEDDIKKVSWSSMIYFYVLCPFRTVAIMALPNFLTNVAHSSFLSLLRPPPTILWSIQTSSSGKYLAAFPLSWSQYTLWGLSFMNPPSSLCVQVISAIVSWFCHPFNKLIRQVAHCLPLSLLPSICPLRVKFSKPSFLIVCPRNFSCLESLLLQGQKVDVSGLWNGRVNQCLQKRPLHRKSQLVMKEKIMLGFYEFAINVQKETRLKTEEEIKLIFDVPSNRTASVKRLKTTSVKNHYTRVLGLWEQNCHCFWYLKENLNLNE